MHVPFTGGLPRIRYNQIKKYSDYNAFRGGLKSALRRTFLTTKGTKGPQRGTKLRPGAQSLNLHVQAGSV